MEKTTRIQKPMPHKLRFPLPSLRRAIMGTLGILFLLNSVLAKESKAVSSPILKVFEKDGTYRVEVRCNDRTLLSSPEQGLWSIAMDWKDGWCAGWRHASPSRMERKFIQIGSELAN